MIQKPSDGAPAMITIDDEALSPRSACIYEFKFPRTAELGDVLNVRVNDTTRVNFYYAEGVDEQTAKGNIVLDPSWGHFQVRFPYTLYLTIKNTDALKKEFDKPIKIDYWQELFNPYAGEDRENAEPIAPTFGLKLTQLITTRESAGSDDGDTNWLIWLVFSVALISVAGGGVVYFVMRQRKKKMQLQKALAEGKVSLKEANEPATDEDSPDKQQVEMQNRGESHRHLMDFERR